MVVVHRNPIYSVSWFGGICFLPGMNNLSDSEFSKVSETEWFKDQVARKIMRIGGRHDSDSSDAVDSVDPAERSEKKAAELASMKVSELTEILKDMSDTPVLNALQKIDYRQGVQKAIEARRIAIKSQEGVDIGHVQVKAPNGDGSNFAENLGKSEADMQGKVAHTAIPALSGEKE